MNELELLKEVLSEYEQSEEASNEDNQESSFTGSDVNSQNDDVVIGKDKEFIRQELQKGNYESKTEQPKKEDKKEIFKKIEEVIQGLENKINSIDDVLNEKMQPIYQKQAEDQLNEQISIIKNKYPELFQSPEGDKILQAIYEYSLNHYEIDKDGSGQEKIKPLSLEKSLLLVLAPRLYQDYKSLIDKERRRQELWGTLDTTAKDSKQQIATEEDLQNAVGEILKKYGL